MKLGLALLRLVVGGLFFGHGLQKLTGSFGGQGLAATGTAFESLGLATMATAIRTVHGPKGPWLTNGGYEYNLVLMAIVFALVDAGPGHWSVDATRGRERWGAGWALAQLGAGLGGSAAVVAFGRRGSAAADDLFEGR